VSRPRRWRGVGIIPLGDDGVKPLQQGDVEHVHPHDRLGAVVAVIVPLAIGRDDEIASAHGELWAAD